MKEKLREINTLCMVGVFTSKSFKAEVFFIIISNVLKHTKGCVKKRESSGRANMRKLRDRQKPFF